MAEPQPKNDGTFRLNDENGKVYMANAERLHQAIGTDKTTMVMANVSGEGGDVYYLLRLSEERAVAEKAFPGLVQARNNAGLSRDDVGLTVIDRQELPSMAITEAGKIELGGTANVRDGDVLISATSMANYDKTHGEGAAVAALTKSVDGAPSAADNMRAIIATAKSEIKMDGVRHDKDAPQQAPEGRATSPGTETKHSGGRAGP